MEAGTEQEGSALVRAARSAWALRDWWAAWKAWRWGQAQVVSVRAGASAREMGCQSGVLLWQRAHEATRAAGAVS